jgi:hypothetical protein
MCHYSYAIGILYYILTELSASDTQAKSLDEKHRVGAEIAFSSKVFRNFSVKWISFLSGV